MTTGKPISTTKNPLNKSGFFHILDIQNVFGFVLFKTQ